jgi:hypothetical protein
VLQVRGFHGQVFVCGVEIWIFRPGIPPKTLVIPAITLVILSERSESKDLRFGHFP